MSQLFESPINIFSALMDRIPEVHTKWGQVQFRISKQKFEIYIILLNRTNMQIDFTFPEDSGPTMKKTFQNHNNSETLVMQQLGILLIYVCPYIYLFHTNHFGCNLPVEHIVRSLLLNRFFKKKEVQSWSFFKPCRLQQTHLPVIPPSVIWKEH